MRALVWLEDFNNPAPDRLPSEPEACPDPEPIAPPPDPCAEAWTDGFLAGGRLREQNALSANQTFAADLSRRLTEMEARLQAAADQSAALMGGLLIDMLSATLPPGWPAGIAERLGAVTAAIRPLFVLDPHLHIHGEMAGELAFRDLPSFYKALESHPPAGLLNGPADISWRVAAQPADIAPVLTAALDCEDALALPVTV